MNIWNAHLKIFAINLLNFCAFYTFVLLFILILNLFEESKCTTLILLLICLFFSVKSMTAYCAFLLQLFDTNPTDSFHNCSFFMTYSFDVIISILFSLALLEYFFSLY